jgi:hypothetical protein
VISTACVLTGDKGKDAANCGNDAYVTQNQVVETSCWFESGQGTKAINPPLVHAGANSRDALGCSG